MGSNPTSEPSGNDATMRLRTYPDGTVLPQSRASHQCNRACVGTNITEQSLRGLVAILIGARRYQLRAHTITDTKCLCKNVKCLCCAQLAFTFAFIRTDRYCLARMMGLSARRRVHQRADAYNHIKMHFVRSLLIARSVVASQFLDSTWRTNWPAKHSIVSVITPDLD